MPYPYYPGYYPQYGQINQMQGTQMSLPNQQSLQAQPANQDERIWVTGESGAQAYLVAPNGFVRLWDSNAPVYYEKRADAAGRPYMDVFEYRRKGAQEPNPAVLPSDRGNDYANQINALERRIAALEKGVQKHDEQPNADD